MKSLSISTVTLLTIAVSVPSHAATWLVPSQCPTIQAGVDSAASGDTVLVAAGTYTGDGSRDIALNGKNNLAIMSQAGRELTTINCEGSSADLHRAFYLNGQSCLIDGFTIEGGYQGQGGGGIHCPDWKYATVRNCTFSGNTALGYGGAVYVEMDCGLTLEDCVFEDNSAGASGGGLWVYYWSQVSLTDCDFIGNWAHGYYGVGGGGACLVHCSPSLTRCSFLENTTDGTGGAVACYDSADATFNQCIFSDNSCNLHGGALYCADASPPTLIGGLVVGNSAGEQGGGLYCRNSRDPSVTRCTFSHNSAGVSGGGMHVQTYVNVTVAQTIIAFSTQGEGLSCDGSGTNSLSCCDIYGNAGGDWVGPIAGLLGVSDNFCEDPLFCDPYGGDYTIAESSPCAPTNSPLLCGRIGARYVGCVVTDVADGEGSPPLEFNFALSVPNPFTPTTEIEFSIPSGQHPQGVRLAMYNSLGQQVRTLLDAERPGGIHTVTWNGKDNEGKTVASGVYFCRLSWNGESRVTRMVLLK